MPKRCVYELWSAYNDIAEGFGLTMEEFSEIVKSSCMEYLSVTERILAPDIDALFRLLDDDENKLVDALEFMAALAMLSGMTPEEKIRCKPIGCFTHFLSLSLVCSYLCHVRFR